MVRSRHGDSGARPWFASFVLLAAGVCACLAPQARSGAPAASHDPAPSGPLDVSALLASGKLPPAPREDVAGRFAGLLAEHQDASYADLVRELPLDSPRDTPLGFDPTKINYFDRIQSELKLTGAELGVYRQRGLVSVDHARRYSMGSAYFAIYARDLPVLVTSDSMLHALHRSFDETLKELESEYFIAALDEALAAAHDELDRAKSEISAAGLDASAGDADLFLTVARNLLKGGGDAPAPEAALADEEGNLENICKIDPAACPGMAGEAEVVASKRGNDARVGAIVSAVGALAPAEVELYGNPRPIDFSQFAARGHYTESDWLKRYFRTMIWLGRADTGFIIAPPDEQSRLRADPERELRSASLLTLLFERSKGLTSLGRVRSLIDFMVGHADSLGLAALSAALRKHGVSTIADLGDRGDRENMRRLRHELAAQATQQIRSQAVHSPLTNKRKTDLPQLFQIFGQSFVIDSFVLSQVVFDSIVYRGVKRERMMPSGLDVMAALGNDEAVRLLAPELERHQYAANLLSARKTIESRPPAAWTSDVYDLWLDTLRELDDTPTSEHFPRVMRTQAWRRKQLQTQLASWSELRHDTILYAKQSYTASATCGYPSGYVEPYPRFFHKLELVARAMARLLADSEMVLGDPLTNARLTSLRRRQVSFFEGFANVSRKLGVLAEKELRAEPFSAEEDRFIKTTIDISGGGSGPPRYDGWYPRLIYGGAPDEWKPTIADVHTNPADGAVLQVGVGDVNFLILAVDNQGDRAAYVGPIYSYYEFSQPVGQRLTNELWRERIQKGDLPPRPAFSRLFRVDGVERDVGQGRSRGERRRQPGRRETLEERQKRTSRDYRRNEAESQRRDVEQKQQGVAPVPP